MSLEIPDDYDDGQSDEPDDGMAVVDSTDGQQPATDEPAAESHRDLDEEIGDLWEGIEANAGVITGKASVTEVEAVHERLTALEQRLTELEEDHQSIRDYLHDLEKSRREDPKPSAEEVADIKPLAAAVFDNEPECPGCGEGNLHMSGPFLGRRVVCSDDTCEFSRQVADF